MQVTSAIMLICTGCGWKLITRGGDKALVLVWEKTAQTPFHSRHVDQPIIREHRKSTTPSLTRLDACGVTWSLVLLWSWKVGELTTFAVASLTNPVASDCVLRHAIVRQSLLYLCNEMFQRLQYAIIYIVVNHLFCSSKEQFTPLPFSGVPGSIGCTSAHQWLDFQPCQQ